MYTKDCRNDATMAWAAKYCSVLRKTTIGGARHIARHLIFWLSTGSTCGHQVSWPRTSWTCSVADFAVLALVTGPAIALLGLLVACAAREAAVCLAEVARPRVALLLHSEQLFMAGALVHG